MVKRDDGSSMMLNNIYQKNIDTQTLGKQQWKPGTRTVKNDASVIEATNTIIDDAAKDQ